MELIPVDMTEPKNIKDKFKRHRVLQDLICTAEYDNCSHSILNLLTWRCKIVVYPWEQADFLFEPFRISYNTRWICDRERYIRTWSRGDLKPFKDGSEDEHFLYCIDVESDIKINLYDLVKIRLNPVSPDPNIIVKYTNFRAKMAPLLVSLPYKITEPTTIYNKWHIFETGGGDGGYICFEKYKYNDIFRIGGCSKVLMTPSHITCFSVCYNRKKAYINNILTDIFGKDIYSVIHPYIRFI